MSWLATLQNCLLIDVDVQNLVLVLFCRLSIMFEGNENLAVKASSCTIILMKKDQLNNSRDILFIWFCVTFFLFHLEKDNISDSNYHKRPACHDLCAPQSKLMEINHQLSYAVSEISDRLIAPPKQGEDEILMKSHNIVIEYCNRFKICGYFVIISNSSKEKYIVLPIPCD